MSTIKSFTSVEQSRKLAEILPIDSADMYWDYDVQKHEYYPMVMDDQFDDTCIRAWSLAALLDVLSYPSLHKTVSGWRCDSYNKKGTSFILGESSDNPVDTCYELILKLHELNLL